MFSSVAGTGSVLEQEEGTSPGQPARLVACTRDSNAIASPSAAHDTTLLYFSAPQLHSTSLHHSRTCVLSLNLSCLKLEDQHTVTSIKSST